MFTMISQPRIRTLPSHADYVSPSLILEYLMVDEGWSETKFALN